MSTCLQLANPPTVRLEFKACRHVQAPRLAEHMLREGVHATMFCSHWFLTLLAYTLPAEHLLRVWDVLFLEGVHIVFRHVLSHTR